MTAADALLDTLLPGDGDFPPGSLIAAALSVHDRFAAPLATVLAALPQDFVAKSPDGRTSILQSVEAADPATFGALVVGAYSLYYTHPQVAAALARLTGHSGAPPQPQGHALPAFDPALLAIPAARQPFYRPTPKVAP
jgi:hypothetical protein